MVSKRPESLKPGDKIALVATARKVSPDEMQPAITLFQQWGLSVWIDEGLYAADYQMAGNDRHRTQQLQQALDDRDTKAIICARGGYGTVRIVDSLDWSLFQANPKWVVGYSDVTVLHSHIHRQLSIATLHAIMPINIPPDASRCEYPATSSLHQVLFGTNLVYPQLNGNGGYHLFRSGTVTAPIVGGNLSILYSLLGSVSDIDTRDKILFIEDVDEYLYHIDRMIMALKRNGKLSHLAGLMVGAMSDLHDNTIPFGRDAYGIIWDAVKEFHYPVTFDVQAGHIGTQNLALPLGLPVTLCVTKDGNSSLTY